MLCRIRIGMSPGPASCRSSGAASDRTKGARGRADPGCHEAHTVGSGQAGSPEAAATARGAVLDPRQTGREARVGRDRERARETTPDQLRVDEARAEVNIGEQPAVDVPGLGADPQAHPAPGDEAVVEG